MIILTNKNIKFMNILYKMYKKIIKLVLIGILNCLNFPFFDYKKNLFFF
jgi:hypothetical protein